MRLTKLEIKGFKSFADKTVIHFNDNITGIVGPNGCGKSNVVDSIRWVLGEQKTSMLRLEKMDNLIFNGTKKRKASGLAEVSLTFENTKNVIATEFKTVTVTRKLYRNGDSEYRLNDVSCRLKDITNLFLDTGVSSDSYAIIELGMVDEILNDRDNSRRKLFEQASGISKYKKRKKETLNKLKGTEADLARVEDLLFEIENNLKILEKQAKRTERYHKLKARYKENSLELCKITLADYKGSYQQLENDQKNQTDKKIEIDKLMIELEAKIEKEKLGNLDKEKALSEIQKQLNDLIGNVGSKENERNLLREQLKFNIEKQDTARERLKELTPKIDSIEFDIKKFNDQKTEQEKTYNDATAKLEELQNRLSEVREKHNLLKANLDDEKKQFTSLNEEYNELERKIAVNKATIEKYQSDLFLFKEESKTKEEEFKAANKELKEIESQKNKEEKALQKIEESEQKLIKERQDLQEELENRRKELFSVNRNLDACKNEYDLTKSLVESLEGFPDSIKFLKKNETWSKDARLVTDIIYCEEKYRVPIENFLDAKLNYYVVRKTKEAVKGIHLLSDSSKGRANFYVLEHFEKFKGHQPVLDERVVSALDLVEFDKEFAKLGEYLLGNVYFVKESDLDNVLADKKFDSANLLTFSGKIQKKQYAFSGGAIGLFEGKRIGRSKNLEKLNKEISKLEKNASKLEDITEKLSKKLNTLREESNEDALKTQRQVTQEIASKYSSVKSKIEHINSSIENAKQRSKNLDDALKELNDSNKELKESINSIVQKRDALKNEVQSKDSAFVEVSTALEEASRAFNEHNILYHQEKNRLENIDREQQFKAQELKSIKEQIESNNTVITNSEEVIQGNKEKLQKLESDLLSGYENKDSFELKVRTAEQAFFDSRGTLNELDDEYREMQKRKQNTDTLLSEIKDKFNELKLELSSIRERLSLEFNIGINDIINEEINADISREELEEKVAKWKHRIDTFGEINPMAIEAYEEMKKRYDFIQSQRTDLLNAKDSLLETIAEIEETAKTKFLEAYNSVRENFKEVFRTLFTEDDQCDLKLLDEENPLESKIEIIAKPKGKRPTIIDQLSGGEKTLTATALLFSLYLLKPAPFCIFDEVDAPLDDNNIDKFNKIIRKFSEESQFIIVTHNKQTMGHVDVIYGVTMAEQGVSKVVPVDFRALKAV